MPKSARVGKKKKNTIMKNKKFSIQTIEEGRMEDHEIKQIYGGDIGCVTYSCPSDYSVGFCLNILRTCSGAYQYCDTIADESCSGTFRITVPIGMQ